MNSILEKLKQILLKASDIIDSMRNLPQETATNQDTLGSDWGNTVVAHHNVRALCDLEGLSFEQKETLTACVYQESRFDINAKHENIVDGKVSSTDWGIVQVNDYFHIGPGKDFPSVEYVLSHPEECVRWMCKLFKAGQANLWSSYSTGAYKQWLGKV